MHIGLMIFLALVACFGTVGNIFIIGAVCLQKRLRVRGNAFVINLAIADLIITAYIMPIGLATSQYKVSPFGEALCDINAFLIMTSCGASTQSLMMIAIERYVHICKMGWYRRLFKNKLIAFNIAFCWIYSSIWTMQGWTGWTKFLYGDDIYVCLFDGTFSLSYDVCLAFFGMVLPLIVLSFCYFNIFRAVRKTRAAINITKLKARDMKNQSDPGVSEALSKSRKESEREYRLVLTLFTIVVIFCVMWTPAAIILVISGSWEMMPKILYTFSVWMAFCNSSMNSIVYGIMNKNFRKGYALMFRALFCTNYCKETVCWKQYQASKLKTSDGSGTRGSQDTGKEATPDTSVTNASKKKDKGITEEIADSDPTDSPSRSTGSAEIELNMLKEEGNDANKFENMEIYHDNQGTCPSPTSGINEQIASPTDPVGSCGTSSEYIPKTRRRQDGFLETKM